MPEPTAEPKPDDIPASQGVSRRSGKRRRLYIGLGILGFIVLVVAGLVGGFYLSFTMKVHEANARMQPDIEQALATPPSTTLVTSPQASGPTSTDGAPAEPPIDLLVLGTDARPGEVESPGASDVLMLFHVDRAQDFVSILSIPRDLYVHLPGYGMDRINAGYYRGGPAMTIAAIKEALGVDVTKYIGVGFAKFPGIIDSLGGIYVDVDRRYTDEDPRWPHRLAAGYQLLNGDDALLFARYRFDGNSDFGRMARQQRILAAVRQQAVGWNLTVKLPGIVDKLMDSTTTNLSAGELVKLSSWLIRLDGERIKQRIIRGPGTMIDGKAVIVADKATLAEAVKELFTAPEEEQAPTSRAEPQRLPVSVGSDTGAYLAAEGDAALRSALAAPTTTTKTTPVTAAPTTATTQLPFLPDAATWRAAQAGVSFALEAPRFLPDGFTYAYKVPQGEGTYGIKVGDETKPAVRMAYRYKTSDLYLGVSATTWLEAPLAAEGTMLRNNGVVYTVVGTRDHPDYVWWTRNGVLYFISNTLMSTVSEQDLVAMAESMSPVGGAGQ